MTPPLFADHLYLSNYLPTVPKGRYLGTKIHFGLMESKRRERERERRLWTSIGKGMRLMFWRSWVRIQTPYTGWTFFTLIGWKNCIVCLWKINKKEVSDSPFLKTLFSINCRLNITNRIKGDTRITSDIFNNGQPRPLLSFIFGSFQTNINTIDATNKCEKMSIQYMVPGFEPTTFRSWVSSYNH